MIRFQFDEKKALEALVFIAQEWPGITAFYGAKCAFIADKRHLNKYGRPVIGDRYIAMDNGPVPSAVYDWFKGNLERFADPKAIVEAIDFRRNGKLVEAHAKRKPDVGIFSPSDIDALRDAVSYCRRHGVGKLSRITHDDPAWKAASLNAEMDPALMIEGDNREEIVEAAEEFAAYGVA